MDYARVFSHFWRGRTGREIGQRDRIVRIVATYVMTADVANSQGLYRLCLEDAAYQIGARADTPTVWDAMVELKGLGFLDYDPMSEIVWVKRMAHYQYMPLPLRTGDKRVTGLDRWYAHVAPNYFLGDWWDTYAGPNALNMTCPRRAGTEETTALVATVLPVRTSPLLASPNLDLGRDTEGASEGLELLPPPTTHTSPSGFVEFWTFYPKKRARPRCEVEWRRQKVTAQDVVVMVAKLRDPYTFWPEWAQGRILDPVNFLKDRRWLDEAAPTLAPLSQRSQDTMRKTESIRQMMQKSLTDGSGQEGHRRDG